MRINEFLQLRRNNMRFLGIDTTKKQSYLWLFDNEKTAVKILPAYEKHSETLLINIDKFLTQNSLILSDIDVLVNVSGPGSFTGIRIGLSTVKAFAYALNKKIVNISVFDLLKNHIKNGILLLECTSNSVYFCDIVRGKIDNYGVLEKKDFEEKLINKNIFVLVDEHIDLPQSYKVSVIDNYDAIALNSIIDCVKKGEFTDNPEPFYIQLSQAERALKEKEDRNENN